METRVDQWKRKLLDLSLWNPLLNARDGAKFLPFDGGFLRRCLAVVAMVLISTCLFAEDKDEATKDTIAHINHLNWVVSKIKTYNNVMVLEEEYRQISPARLNLNRIPDKEALDRIVAMLDLLHGMIKDERDYKRWKKCFETRQRREMVRFWTEQGFSATSQLSTDTARLCAGDFSAVYSISKSAVGVYRDYDDFVNRIEDESERRKFEIEDSKMERLHALNKDLLQTQWRLIHDLKLDDSLRVSDTDISILIEIMKDPDHNRVYSRMEAMRDKFPIFPTYWCYLSGVALETGHKKEAMEACDTFFKVNRGLFRDDPQAGTVAMNKAFLMPKTEENKAEIRKLLELVWKHNAANIEWRKDYFCATVYATYLGDKAMAEKVLLHGIAALEFVVSETIHSMNDILDGQKIASMDIEIPEGECLRSCRRLLQDIQADAVVYDERGLEQLCANETASYIDKMDYVGRMRIPCLWKAIANDVASVSLVRRGLSSWKGGNRFEVKLPIRWLLSGKLNARLEAAVARKVIANSKEARNDRTISDDGRVSLSFDLGDLDLTSVDVFRLCFDHDEYPVRMLFASATPYTSGEKASVAKISVLDGKFNEGHNADDLRLMKVFIKGNGYVYNGKDVPFVERGKETPWVELFRETFPNLSGFSYGSMRVGENGVDEVVFNEDGQMRIIYQNDGPDKIRPAVSIYLLNEYGVVVRRIKDVWRMKRLGVGERAESKWFSVPQNITYVDVETSK